MGQLFSKPPCILSIYFLIGPLNRQVYSQLMKNRTGKNPYMPFVIKTRQSILWKH